MCSTICNATWIDQQLNLAMVDKEKLTKICDSEVLDGVMGCKNDGIGLGVFSWLNGAI